MFGRDKDPVTAAATSPTGDESNPTDVTGKGRPTPKRKDAEAANKRPLVPTDRKSAGKANKSASREARNREYQAMQTGDERSMPPNHRGPVRRDIRDYVDGRWNLGEFFLPIAAVFLVLQISLANSAPDLAALAVIILYAYVIFAIVDGFIMWRGLRKRLRAKFGEDKLGRGLVMYSLMRSFQLRPTRLPKAQVKRGTKPE
ncbi:DUF3043 domain-containing protein [Cellulomonas rhizosphaerae]|uniref:DUF3043 domain-containing protein n=1 Tax=Cellulomonas rhizosphaerae TaxID=2293719 RepID=A0A413RLA0_9CELL|nr:DUF3043 domain-containing protein [Cellulomonas rhizosphaerae]RHA40316.1 DUF3043 domain-containing protein [Cellulomonas rhizosphaerae]